MRSTLIGLAAVAALAILPAAVVADDHGAVVHETAYESTGLDGHPSLRGGGVIDVTFGRTHGALEIHAVEGAAPETTYEVVGEIFFSSACGVDDAEGPVEVPEGRLTTDAAGDGIFEARFPGETLGTAPDAFHVRWSLRSDGSVAYRSGCVEVRLAA